MSRSTKQHKRAPALGLTAAGFSVLELLIVMVMFGVLLAVAVPNLMRAYGQRLPRLAADRFVAQHMRARSTAVRMGRTAVLRIDATTGNAWVEVEAGASRDTVGGTKSLTDNGMTMTSDRSLLCYDGRGLPTTRTLNDGSVCDAPGGTLTFTWKSHVATVQITALGKVLR